MIALRAALVGGMLAVLAAACSGGGSAASASAPPDADLVVESVDMAFDTDTITLTAGEPTTVFYRNLDGEPHNIAIYADESASEQLFVGETITDDAVTYEIPVLEPGEYFFRCDVHPDMNGTVIAEEG
jgi:plastocyanin